MLFDKVIAFDHFRQQMILMVNMPLEDPETGYRKAALELEQLCRLLRTGEKKQEPGGHLTGEITPLFDKDTFCSMVEKAKRHIREGDIFQIVPVQPAGSPLLRQPVQHLPHPAHHEPLSLYVLPVRHRCRGGRGLPGNPGEAGKRRAPHLPPGRHPAPGQNAGRGQSPGRGASGRRKGAGRAQYAGGFGPQRLGESQPDSAPFPWSGSTVSSAIPT